MKVPAPQPTLADLMDQLKRGDINRRQFLREAASTGISLTAALIIANCLAPREGD